MALVRQLDAAPFLLNFLIESKKTHKMSDEMIFGESEKKSKNNNQNRSNCKNGETSDQPGSEQRAKNKRF